MSSHPAEGFAQCAGVGERLADRPIGLLRAQTHQLRCRRGDARTPDKAQHGEGLTESRGRGYQHTADPALDFDPEDQRVEEFGEDPEEVLREELSLEPDYFFDLVDL